MNLNYCIFLLLIKKLELSTQHTKLYYSIVVPNYKYEINAVDLEYKAIVMPKIFYVHKFISVSYKCLYFTAYMKSISYFLALDSEQYINKNIEEIFPLVVDRINSIIYAATCEYISANKSIFKHSYSHLKSSCEKIKQIVPGDILDANFLKFQKITRKDVFLYIIQKLSNQLIYNILKYIYLLVKDKNFFFGSNYWATTTMSEYKHGFPVKSNHSLASLLFSDAIKNFNIDFVLIINNIPLINRQNIQIEFDITPFVIYCINLYIKKFKKATGNLVYEKFHTHMSNMLEKPLEDLKNLLFNLTINAVRTNMKFDFIYIVFDMKLLIHFVQYFYCLTNEKLIALISEMQSIKELIHNFQRSNVDCYINYEYNVNDPEIWESTRICSKFLMFNPAYRHSMLSLFFLHSAKNKYYSSIIKLLNKITENVFNLPDIYDDHFFPIMDESYESDIPDCFRKSLMERLNDFQYNDISFIKNLGINELNLLNNLVLLIQQCLLIYISLQLNFTVLKENELESFESAIFDKENAKWATFESLNMLCELSSEKTIPIKDIYALVDSKLREENQ